MQRLIDSVPPKEFSHQSVQHLPNAFSGVQGMEFQRALDEQVRQLEDEGQKYAGKTIPGLTAEGTARDGTARDGVRDDLFLPPKAGSDLVSSSPGSVSVKTLPQTASPLPEALSTGPGGNKTAIGHLEQAGDESGGKSGIRGGFVSGKTLPAARQSANATGPAAVPDSVSAPAMGSLVVAGVSQPAGDVAVATIRPTLQSDSLAANTRVLGRDTICQAEASEDVSESEGTEDAKDATDASLLQPGGSEGSVASKARSFEGSAANSAGNQAHAGGAAAIGEPRSETAGETAISPKPQGEESSPSEDSPAAATPVSSQTPDLKSAVRLLRGAPSQSIPNPGAPASQASASSRSSFESGLNACRVEGVATAPLAHLAPSASAISNRAADPYQTMDQVPGAPTPVVNAGANRVAVGLHDPALGWLEIKTQSTAGQVAAALVASSAQSHQALAAQLPSMAQFLSDREVKVSSIAVQQHAVGGGGGDMAGFSDQTKSNSQAANDDTELEVISRAPANTFDSGFESIEQVGPLSYISVIA